MTVFRPADAEEAQQVIAEAAGSGQSLEIVAGGTKRGLGRPARTEHQLDVARLAGIIDYDPPELVLTARAATPMAEIEAQLVARQQMLAFEPPDWRALLGSVGEPTLGGVIACNLAGPRRVRAGAARDHLLGFAAINGWGDPWKSGGRVVKNVTGYDMCKLQSGAYGTLSLLTELSVRVVPRPMLAVSLVLHDLPDADGCAAMQQALNSPHEVSAAAHLPAALVQRSGVSGLAGALTVLRLEGHAPSVAFRIGALEALFGQGTRLEPTESAELWSEVSTVVPLLATGGCCVWRICPTPSAAAEVVWAIRARIPAAEALYDWGGGLVWLSLPATADGGAAVVRAAVREAGGHATLIVAADETRAGIAVFEPETAALTALSKRVKDSFDPRAILNPGRVREGL